MRLALARLSLGLALGFLAWVLAHWSWAALSPRSAPNEPLMPADPTAELNELALFGRSEPSRTTNAIAPNAEPGQWVLLGVAAEADGGGWALLKKSDRNVRLVQLGEEIGPNERLEKVLAQGIVFSRNGREHRLDLRRATGAPPDPPRAGETAPCPTGIEERRRTFFVHPELLSGFAQSLAAARKSFRQEDGAWIVARIDPSLTALGFSLGDRLEKANGVPLSSEESLRTALFEPLMQSRLLKIGGTRKGKAREWIFANAALCAR